MPLPQNIPVNITTENVWAVLDTVESDFEDDLTDGGLRYRICG